MAQEAGLGLFACAEHEPGAHLGDFYGPVLYEATACEACVRWAKRLKQRYLVVLTRKSGVRSDVDDGENVVSCGEGVDTYCVVDLQNTVWGYSNSVHDFEQTIKPDMRGVVRIDTEANVFGGVELVWDYGKDFVIPT